MSVEAVLPLLQNAALLVATAVIFDSAPTKREGSAVDFKSKLLHGIALAAVTLVAMLTPWTVVPGVVFDARSVIISLAALFFGSITTLVIVLAAATLRVLQSGAGVVPAIFAMLGAAGMGTLWRARLKHDQSEIKPFQLLVFGLCAHIMVLAAMLLLPWPTAFVVLRAISAPMLLIMPVATMLIGLLFVRRLKRDRAYQQLEEAHQRQRILHHELQHRVKNSLTMIAAMISLQREHYHGAEAREALSDLHGRVDVLARLYGMLHQHGDNEIDVAPLLTTVCDSLKTALGRPGIEIKTEIDDALLEARQASAVGIIANELLTNALKHAFPVSKPGSESAVSDGSIQLSFHRRNDQYTLELCDNGVGLPADFDPLQSGGFGIELVRLLSSQLHGTLVFGRPAILDGEDPQVAGTSGSCFRVVFPA